MLIQALFKLAGFLNGYAKQKFGMSNKDLPEITGFLDMKTLQTIWAFQRHNASRLLKTNQSVPKLF